MGHGRHREHPRLGRGQGRAARAGAGAPLGPIRALLTAYAGDEGGRRLIHAARCLNPKETEGISERLRATGLPVLVVWGAQDEYLPIEAVGRPLAAALGANLIAVFGGHFLPL